MQKHDSSFGAYMGFRPPTRRWDANAVFLAVLIPLAITLIAGAGYQMRMKEELASGCLPVPVSAAPAPIKVETVPLTPELACMHYNATGRGHLCP